jgi:hypothetical protein
MNNILLKAVVKSSMPITLGTYVHMIHMSLGTENSCLGTHGTVLVQKPLVVRPFRSNKEQNMTDLTRTGYENGPN